METHYDAHGKKEGRRWGCLATTLSAACGRRNYIDVHTACSPQQDTVTDVDAITALFATACRIGLYSNCSSCCS